MKPALENRIRDAIRTGISRQPNVFRHGLEIALRIVSLSAGCTEAEARAVWDKHFAITEAN